MLKKLLRWRSKTSTLFLTDRNCGIRHVDWIYFVSPFQIRSVSSNDGDTTSKLTDITDFDLYSILKVTPNASQKQIKAAYYQQSMLLHPDRNKNSAHASNDKFTQLTEAYKILSDIVTRKTYDRKRRVASAPHAYQSYSSPANASSASFHDDVIARHQVSSGSGRYDKWTQSHYQQTLVTRDERLKRNILRYEATHEETRHQNTRKLTLFVITCLVTAAWFMQRVTRNKQKKPSSMK